MQTIYYGHIDKIEQSEEDLYFEFHCLEQTIWDKKLYLEYDSFHNEILSHQGQVIVLYTFMSKISSIYHFDNFLDLESEWVILYTNNEKRGIDAQLFVEGEVEPRYISIEDINLLDRDSQTSVLLNDKISLDHFKDAKDYELLQLLERNIGYHAEFIAVYNVGQGNCNAVCNSACQPLLYFDLGGGCYTNRHTYSTALRFCFSTLPPIVLSHWDTDHYQSVKLNASYLTHDWIIPRQKISPVHFKFFLSISGTKLIWPPALTSLSFIWGELCVCSGPVGKKNHTGLAFSAALHPHSNSIRQVLLPADAAYTYIPCTAIATFEGLIATHHGANFDNSNHPLPTATGAAAISYSYGNGNTYSHPKSTAQGAHDHALWLTASCRNTDGGNIAITASPFPCSLGCSGRNCDLAIVQVF